MLLRVPLLGPAQFVPGPDADPAVLAAYLVAGLLVSLLAVYALVKVGRVAYRLSKPVLTSLDRRLPVPVPTGATNRVILTILGLFLAAVALYLALSTAAPYLFYGEPLPGVEIGGDQAVLRYENDVHRLGGASPLALDRDADGDRLPDAWERAGETPEGAALPDADPQHKDLYVQVNRGVTGQELSTGERAALRRVWADMPVNNPDGESGIRLHLDTTPPGGSQLGTLAQVTDPPQAGRFYTRDTLDRRHCLYQQLTIGQVGPENTTVVSEAPGHAVVLDTGRRANLGDLSWRVHAITHGLLHTIVGPIEGETVHTDTGWLVVSPHSTDTTLTERVAQTLSRRGFARPIDGPCGNGTASQ